MRAYALATGSALYLALALTTSPVGAEDSLTVGIAGRSSQTPWAAALGNVVAVAFGAQVPVGGQDVYVVISRDSGRSFGAAVRVNGVEGNARLGGELPPRVGLRARAGLDPEIVVAFGARAGTATQIQIVRSADGGRTYTAPRALQAAGAVGDRGWHAMTVDAHGQTHLLWLDHRGLAPAGGAATRGERSHQHAEKEAIDGVAMAQRSALYYARDGVEAVGERSVLSGVCYCCKVALASTPAGGLVAAWRHVYPGNIRDIAFITSADGGRTFTEPARVSHDDWHLAGCPDDGPALAVDSRGTSHLVWPTVVGGTEGAIFYASSRDGRAFSARMKVPTLGSPRPMHPQVTIESATRGYVAWDEVIGGVRQAALRPVAFDTAGAPTFGEVRRLGQPDVPTSYPMVVATSTGALAIFVEGKPGASTIRVLPL
jgi:hypothetical protein